MGNVQFDFKKMSSDKSAASFKIANRVEPNLFSKLSSLDLIATLAKYANDENISVVFELAIGEVEVYNQFKIFLSCFCLLCYF